MSVKNKFNKKALSPVIATVLLILIAIVLVGLLAIFLLPGLTSNVKEKAACFEAINKINFDKSGYNCYYTIDDKKRTAFAVKIDGTDIIGFRVGLIASGAADTFDIKDGTSVNFLRMFNGEFNAPLEVVNEGGVRTYVASGLYDKVDIFPILASDESYICQGTRKSLNLGQCLDANIKNNLDDGGSNPICNKDGVCGDGENINNCPQDCKVCGNGKLDVDKGEQCDAGLYEGGKNDCAAWNYDSGTLSCDSQCKISGCFNSPPIPCEITNVAWEKTSALEGESVKITVTGNDHCDGTSVNFKVKEDDQLVGDKLDDDVNTEPSSAKFTGNTAVSIWTAEWQADVVNPPEYYIVATTDKDYKSPTNDASELKVYACGDNAINGGDLCDGSDLGGKTCVDLGFNSGNLGCFVRGTPNQCTFDTSQCSSNDVCGDGNDVCKPGDTQACTVNGYAGTKTCNAYCSGWGNCVPTESCGDGTKNGNEQCDATDFGVKGNLCSAYSHNPPWENGQVKCNLQCKLNYGQCGFCGDGTKNGNEQCDDGNKNNGDGCSASCTTEGGGPQVCGNGKLEAPPETCDDGNKNNGDGCDSNCQIEGNGQDGSPWHCSGGLGQLSRCCNENTGKCAGQDGLPPYDHSQETTDGCLGPNVPGSCAYAFGNQFGWIGGDIGKCPSLGGIGLCSAWDEGCPNNPYCPYEGYVYGFSKTACCYEHGICQTLFTECICTGS